MSQRRTSIPASLTPVFVASFAACASASYVGLKWTVHALSMMRPLTWVPKVNLADVVVLQHRLVAAVGRPVRRHVVDRAAGGEGDPRLQPVLLHQLAVEVLELLADVGHQHARLDRRLHVLPHLAVALRREPHLLVVDVLEALAVAQLGRRRPEPVGVVGVLVLLADRHLARRELREHRHRRRHRLLRAAALGARVAAPLADAAQLRRPLLVGHPPAAAAAARRRRAARRAAVALRRQRRLQLLLPRRRALLRLALFLRRALLAALALLVAAAVAVAVAAGAGSAPASRRRCRPLGRLLRLLPRFFGGVFRLRALAVHGHRGDALLYFLVRHA